MLHKIADSDLNVWKWREKIRVVQMNNHRAMIGLSDEMRNEKIRELVGVDESMMRLYGHMRMDESGMVKRGFESKLTDVRRMS